MSVKEAGRLGIMRRIDKKDFTTRKAGEELGISLRPLRKIRKRYLKELGVHPSTISRELKRNTGQKGYLISRPYKKAQKKRLGSSHNNQKLVPVLIATIKKKLKLQWSPVQVSGWLKRRGIAISHETIYKHIWRAQKRGRLSL